MLCSNQLSYAAKGADQTGGGILESHPVIVKVMIVP